MSLWQYLNKRHWSTLSLWFSFGTTEQERWWCMTLSVGDWSTVKNTRSGHTKKAEHSENRPWAPASADACSSLGTTGIRLCVDTGTTEGPFLLTAASQWKVATSSSYWCNCFSVEPIQETVKILRRDYFHFRHSVLILCDWWHQRGDKESEVIALNKWATQEVSWNKRKNV